MGFVNRGGCGVAVAGAEKIFDLPPINRGGLSFVPVVFIATRTTGTALFDRPAVPAGRACPAALGGSSAHSDTMRCIVYRLPI